MSRRAVRVSPGEMEILGMLWAEGPLSLFDRVHRLLAEPGRQARWRCAVLLLVALGALGPAAVRLQAVPGREVSGESLAVSLDLDQPGPGSQGRPLAQFGSNDLRTSSFIIDLAFSPDGKLLAAAQPNTQFPRVELFDVQTGRTVAVLKHRDGPVGWVNCVTFSPDSTRLAWGEIGGNVALWDVPGRRMLFREPLHKKEVQDVAFSPDGGLFVSAGGDGVLQHPANGGPGTAAGIIPIGRKEPRPGGFTGVPADGFPVGPLSPRVHPRRHSAARGLRLQRHGLRVADAGSSARAPDPATPTETRAAP